MNWLKKLMGKLFNPGGAQALSVFERFEASRAEALRLTLIAGNRYAIHSVLNSLRYSTPAVPRKTILQAVLLAAKSLHHPTLAESERLEDILDKVKTNRQSLYRSTWIELGLPIDMFNPMMYPLTSPPPNKF